MAREAWMTEAMIERPDPSLATHFEELVRPHQPAMRRLAAATVAHLDPEDVVQEALLRAWRKRDTYRPERGSLRTWLLAITADQGRRLRQRRPDRGWANLDEAIGGGTQTPAPDLDLRRAVSALSPRQRRAVLLYYYVDLSIDETAQLMGCATGTVKSTLADARARLADQLGGDDD